MFGINLLIFALSAKCFFCWEEHRGFHIVLLVRSFLAPVLLCATALSLGGQLFNKMGGRLPILLLALSLSLVSRLFSIDVVFEAKLTAFASTTQFKRAAKLRRYMLPVQ